MSRRATLLLGAVLVAAAGAAGFVWIAPTGPAGTATARWAGSSLPPAS